MDGARAEPPGLDMGDVVWLAGQTLNSALSPSPCPFLGAKHSVTT